MARKGGEDGQECAEDEVFIFDIQDSSVLRQEGYLAQY
jgi:hypothetical protein